MPKSHPTIKDIKKKYELQWIQIDGVEGVGITEMKGKESIVVYTSDKKSLKGKIPEQIEGYSIIFKHTTNFSAF